MTPQAVSSAHSIALNSTLLNTTIEVALRNLDEALGGHPTQTPGAGPASPGRLELCTTIMELPTLGTEMECGRTRPCPIHDGGKKTLTEANALGNDKALADLEVLKVSIKTAERHLTTAARISANWATPRIDDTTVENRLAIINQLLWCTNCAMHGVNSPRRNTGGNYCDFCHDTKVRYKHYPNHWLIDAHGRRNLNSRDYKQFTDTFKKAKIAKKFDKEAAKADLAARREDRLKSA